MRATARFVFLRRGMWLINKLLLSGPRKRFLLECQKRMGKSVFPALDLNAFTERLDKEGLSFGLKLPEDVVAEIGDYAQKTRCYADRDPDLGFFLNEREAMEDRLSKPILVAQYFNTTEYCPAIAQLAADPVIRHIACQYLGAVPKFVGANLWWTFPVAALESDRYRHAHFYHRDVDDYRFVKFFFYLTDVEAGDGAHVCVSGSHRNPPHFRLNDRWIVRRYADAEIERFYPASRIIEIPGAAGDGFAEDTFCIHKGQTPIRAPRLLLQFQYSLFDYGTMHDQRPELKQPPVL